MTADAWILIGVLGGALALFASERVRPDLVGVLALLAVAFAGLVSPDRVFSGFGSPAVITVAGMFVLSAGLVEARVPAAIAALIARLGGGLRLRMALLVLIVGVMSAVMNNIAATVILIPAATTLALGAKSFPSKLLIPVSFGSLLGGLVTLIGTPPNLLVSEALARAGETPFGMFDYAPTGLAVMTVGLLYLLLAGPRLIPAREGADVDREIEQTREFMVELEVPGDSDLAGRTLAQLRWRTRFDIGVVEITHLGVRNRIPGPSDAIYAGDRLIVEGELEAVTRLAQSERLRFAGEDSELTLDDASERTAVVELVAGPGFRFAHQTLVQMNFRRRYGGVVLGIWRQGQRLGRAIRNVQIRPGDVLIVRVPVERVNSFARSPEFILLGRRPARPAVRPHMAVAVLILGAVVGLAAAGIAPIAVTAAAGIILMLLFRVLPYQRLYTAVDWRTIVLIGTLIPLGDAVTTTGLADLAAQWAAEYVSPMGPLAVLAGLFVATALLTQLMSNAAAVVLIAPLALEIAAGAGIAPQPALMMVAISASTAFLTPIGHQANLLVYNAGGYRFVDFLKVGAPLTLLILVTSLIVVPIVWPV